MYFVEFTNTETNDIFYKFGHTSKNDIMERINWITSEYPQFTARVLAHVYDHSIDNVINIEEEFKERYPKNFYLKEKISGVTEIVKMDNNTKNNIIKELRKRNEENKQLLFG